MPIDPDDIENTISADRPPRRGTGRARSRGADTEWDVPARPRTRTHAAHHDTVLDAVRQLPGFIRLLYGLMTDSRVDPLDKMFVAGAIAYVLLPVEAIPDWIPVIGEVDDVFVLIVALRRLINHAGHEVALEHWMGEPEDLDDLSLKRILAAASFFLPRRVRRRLRTIGRL